MDEFISMVYSSVRNTSQFAMSLTWLIGPSCWFTCGVLAHKLGTSVVTVTDKELMESKHWKFPWSNPQPVSNESWFRTHCLHPSYPIRLRAETNTVQENLHPNSTPERYSDIGPASPKWNPSCAHQWIRRLRWTAWCWIGRTHFGWLLNLQIFSLIYCSSKLFQPYCSFDEAALMLC